MYELFFTISKCMYFQGNNMTVFFFLLSGLNMKYALQTFFGAPAWKLCQFLYTLLTLLLL